MKAMRNFISQGLRTVTLLSVTICALFFTVNTYTQLNKIEEGQNDIKQCVYSLQANYDTIVKKIKITNNLKVIMPGLHQHTINFKDAPDFTKIKELTEMLFPVKVMPKEYLFDWYRQIMLIHPLSDLNGRTFGIIVSILYQQHLNSIN